jgi:hypothetical protein
MDIGHYWLATNGDIHTVVWASSAETAGPMGAEQFGEDSDGWIAVQLTDEQVKLLGLEL